jgi:hypothetical protein
MAMDIEEDPEISLSIPVDQNFDIFHHCSEFFNFSCSSQSEISFFIFFTTALLVTFQLHKCKINEDSH